jgi:hypothetical protein
VFRGGFLYDLGKREYLLGVDCGHLPRWNPLRDKKGNTFHDLEVEVNSGQAVVVPAWRLWSLLNQRTVYMARKQNEDEVASDEARQAGMELDTERSRRGPEAERLVIEGDFPDAVKRALEKGKPQRRKKR